MITRQLVATLFFTGAAMAAPIVFNAPLSGPAESPANASPGIGFTTVTLDTAAHTLRIQVVFSGLTGNVTASHIHCCTTVSASGTAGVATVTPTFTGFPLGVTAGSYDFTYDTLAAAGTWNTPFVTANGGTTAGAEAALLAGLRAQKAYLNIHSSTFGGGEIRGFLVETPEPATLTTAGAILALALAGRLLRK